MSALEWAFAVPVLLAGGVIKGSIGFALPLFCVPLLSIFLGPRDAVILMSVPVVLTNLANVHLGWREWRGLRHILPYMGMAVVCVPLGVWFLYWGDPEAIRLILGVAVYVYLALRRLLPPIAALRPTARLGVGAACGVVAGFLAGVASVPGPVSIIYFSMFSWPKDTFIFLINAFNSVTSASLVGSLAYRGAFSAPTLLRVGFALVPVFVGFWAGVGLRRRIRQEAFYRVVRAALFLIATGLVARSLAQIFILGG